MDEDNDRDAVPDFAEPGSEVKLGTICVRGARR